MKVFLMMTTLIFSTFSYSQTWHDVPMKICRCQRSSSSYNVNLTLEIRKLTGELIRQIDLMQFPFNGFDNDIPRAMSECQAEVRYNPACRGIF